MYEDLGEIVLKTGETVHLGAVRAPDPPPGGQVPTLPARGGWRERIEELLAHKGGVWNWQNSELLKSDVAAQSSGYQPDTGGVSPTGRGVEARYYVLHREGSPFANVLVAELAGVGMLGHVFTKPEDRRKGAMGRLIERLMDDFRARGGKALFLGTGFDSVPFRLYERYGFKGIEPGSGYMAYYAASSGRPPRAGKTSACPPGGGDPTGRAASSGQRRGPDNRASSGSTARGELAAGGRTELAEVREEFEAEYFAPGSAIIEGLSWRHWPSSAALFTGDFPGVVRCAPLRMIGRVSTEGSVLELIREASENAEKEDAQPPRAVAARLESSGAVAGFAACGWDTLWPGTCLVDVYCHPDHWERAGEILQALRLPAADRCVAYADSACEPKHACLREAGFRPAAKLAGWVRSGGGKPRALDVQVYRRTSS